jgi:hypothetical protein
MTSLESSTTMIILNKMMLMIIEHNVNNLTSLKFLTVHNLFDISLT